MSPRRSRAIHLRHRKPGEIPTLRAAVRNHCLECMGYQRAQVHRCVTPECWLYPFRAPGKIDKDWPDADQIQERIYGTRAEKPE